MRQSQRLKIATIAMLTPGLTFFAVPIQANPSGGIVVHGDVAIGAGTGGNLQINQNSLNAIINWDDFSIAAGELTQFNQPGANAAVLNRVTGGNPTEIHGALQANGSVFVINTNGILVGAGGTIDVHGLVLSTLDISNGEFLAGGDLVFKGDGEGVTNMGRINAIGGDVFLIGRTVTNTGSITATGTVGLGAGEEILLKANKTATGERMFVRATGAGASGTGVLNDGTIEGAAIELKAHGNMYALAINNKGSIRATGATNSGGRVFLKGVGGSVSNSGSIQASSSGIGSGGRVLIEAAYARVDGMIRAEKAQVRIAASSAAELGGTIDVTSSGGRGGDVVVEAPQISLSDSVVIDASGFSGGGTVQVGGGFQGSDAEILNATTLSVASGAEIKADALNEGNGGVVILWSDDTTNFDGFISARGAGAVGNGGFAEVSGKRTLGYRGLVDLSADHGLSGTLLLDPTNITISSAVDGPDNVNNVNLSNTLDSGTNVIITSNFGVLGPAGNITVNDRVEWYQDTATTVGGTLSLLAMGDVIINDSVRSAGAGGINIVAGWDGSTGLTNPLGQLSEAGPFDMAAVLATMPGGASEGDADAAGRGSGSVLIGNNNTNVQISVGSRFGDTLVAAHDLIMDGDANTAEAFVQLGFADNGTEYQISDFNSDVGGAGVGNGINNGLHNEWWGSFSAADGSGTGFTGTDAVTGKDYIALLGGTADSTGGAGSFLGAGSGAKGDIVARLSGRLDMEAGTTRSYVQIGHGGSGQEGFEARARSTGETRTTRDGYVIDTTNARTFFSTTWKTNTEADPLNGSLYRVEGDIIIQAAGDIQMVASTGITTDPNNVADTNAGSGNYAMIGHGGAENPGSYHGDVTVIAEGAVGSGEGDTATASRLSGIGIDMIGGRADTRFVQIGHGSTREGNPRSIFDMQRSGNITVTAETGAIRMQGYTQTDNRADQYSGVQIGHGGAQADNPANNGTFSGGAAGLNISGVRPDNSSVGNITVFAGGTYNDPNEAGSKIGISARAGNQLYSYAQIGHGGANQQADTGVGYQGDINVQATQGDLLFAGGADKASNRDWGYGRNHAQIGHGGREVDGAKGGLVTVLAGQGAGATDGDIRFMAGKHYESFAQIGHGGYGSGGNYGAVLGALAGNDNDSEITVSAFGDIHFESGASGSANALGVAAYANIWFNELPPVGTRTANGFYNVDDRYVMIGHGGNEADGIMANRHDITISSGTGDLENADGDVSTGGITFISGNQNRDFAQIGHGGRGNGANDDNGFSGDITISANGGGVIFDGSIEGGTRYTRQNRTFDGTTNRTTVHAIEGGQEAYIQIGHGGYAARGRHSGAITLLSYGGLDMIGSVNNTISPQSFVSANGDDLSSVTNSLNNGANLWASLSPRGATAATTGNAFTVSQGPVNLAPGTLRIVLDNGTVITDLPDADNDEQDGDAGSFLVDQDGNVVGDVHYRMGLVRFNTATAGNVETVEYDAVKGYKERAYVQLGNGGYDSDGPNNNRTSGGNSGTISLTVADDIRFHAGAYHRAYAQLGHGGYDTKGAHSGDILINIANGADGGKLEFLAGVNGARHFDYQAYAQLGHGGYASNGNHYGDIRITNGRNDADGIGVLFKAGTNQDNYTQLGHGGRSSRSGENPDASGTGSFGLNGDIVIQTKGDVAFVAGTGIRNNEAWRDDFRLYAQLGHGGWDADPEQSNDNNFGVTNTLFSRNSVGDTTAGEAGVGAGRWGHFGDIVINTTEGDISFMAGNNIALADRLDPEGNIGPITGSDILVSHGDGVGRFHSAMLGHGGIVTSGDHHGSISVITENGSVNVGGGMSSNDNDARLSNFAQIGHTYQYQDGGPNGHLGRSDESIEVMALGANGNINLVAGGGQSNSAKIGLGGRETDGTFLGDIKVYAGNDINLMGGVAEQREVTRIAEFQDMSGANGGNNNDLFEFNSYWGTNGLNYLMMDEAAGLGGDQKTRLMSDDITPGTVEFRIADTTHTYDGAAPADIVDVDNGDGTGNLVVQVDLANGNGVAGTVVGTIDYATSEITWAAAVIENASDHADLFVNYNTTTHISNDAINSFAQIGHGGIDATPLAEIHPETGLADQLGHSGNIDVRAGVDALGNYTGTAGTITALAGNDRRNFVQIGHGGVSSIAPTDGYFSGTIDVMAGGGIRFKGGETLQDDYNVAWNYDPSQASNANNVRVGGVPGGTTNRGITDMDYNFAMIGHGGVNSDADNSLDNTSNDPNSTREGHNGDIFVQASKGDIQFEAGGGRGYGHFTQIGHGGFNSNGNHYGNIEVEALEGDIEFIGGGQTYDSNNTDQRAYSMIGHGGHGMTGNLGRIGESIIVTATLGEIDFHGTPMNNLGSAVPYAAHVYTLNRPNNQDENHRNRARGDENFTMIGHGGSFVYGDKTAEILVTAGNGISFSGGLIDAEPDPIDAENDQAASYNFAQIGHGGYFSYRQYRSNVVPGTVTHADDFNVPSNLDGTGFPFWPTDNSIDAAAGQGLPLYDGFSGDVTVLATGGDITFTGGNGANTFARIGHGGYETAGDHSGTIDVEATVGRISFNADVDLHGTNAGFANGGTNTFTQIGHGGFYSDGEIRSDIFVTAGSDLVFDGGDSNSFTMIGHGGFADGGTRTDRWGGSNAAFRRSNDRAYRPATRSGNIDVESGGDILFTAGNDDGDLGFAQIGHGGRQVAANPWGSAYGDGHSGQIDVAATGEIIFEGGSRRGDYVMIGHGGYETFGNHGGDGISDNRLDSDITVVAGDGIEFKGTGISNTNTARNFAQIGHGGWRSSFRDVQDLDGANFAILGPYDNGGLLSNNGGRNPWEPYTTNPDGLALDFLTGLPINGDANFIAPLSGTPSAGAATIGTFMGDITVRTTNAGADIRFLAPSEEEGTMYGNAGESHVMIGHGGFRVFADVVGDITVESAGGIDFNAAQGNGTRNSNHQGAFALLGHGGYESGGEYEGNIIVSSVDTVSFKGADSVDGANVGFAQLGHGGFNSDDDHGEYLDAIRNIDGSRPAGDDDAGNSGSITVTVTSGDLEFLAGKDSDTYAQLGHGGRSTRDTHHGDITVNVAGGIRFIAGVDASTGDTNPGGNERSYVQLGHGGNDSDGSHYGNIAVTAGSFAAGPEIGKGIVFRSGDHLNNSSQIGHGGHGTRTYGTVAGGGEGFEGSITVLADGDIHFAAGSAFKGDNPLDVGNEAINYTQIGHGGYDADAYKDADRQLASGVVEGHSGDISVVTTRGNITFLAAQSGFEATPGDGGGNYHYAQIGHGGALAQGDHHGNIEVRAGIEQDGTVTDATSDILFAAGGGTMDDWADNNNYAQLGHGGRMDGNTASSSGNFGLATEVISVMAGNDILLTSAGGVNNYAQIGNGGYNARGDHQGDIQILANGSFSATSAQMTADGSLGSYRVAYSFERPDADGNEHRSLDRAAEYLADTDNTTRAAGVADLQFNRAIAGTMEVRIYDDAGNLVMTLRDLNNDNTLVVVSDATLDNVDANADRISGTETFTAGTVVGSYTQGNITFDRDVNPGSNPYGGSRNIGVVYESTMTDRSYVQVGHGGYDSDNTNGDTSLGNSGNISISARTGNIDILGGNDDENYALVGHGGRSTSGLNDGNIAVRAGGSVMVSGGYENGARAFAQIGHGGYDSRGSHSGAIKVSAGSGDLFTSIATGTFNDLGDFNFDSVADEIVFTSSGLQTVSVLGGGAPVTPGGTDNLGNGGDDSHAMIGHGGRSSALNGGTLDGDIGVSATGDIRVEGGRNDRTFAQIGNGGWNENQSTDISGDISVISENGDLLVKAGELRPESYALIGHGDDQDNNTVNSAGSREGRIFVAANEITLDRSGQEIAWIGHSFRRTDNVQNPYNTGNLELSNLDAASTYVPAGHQIIARNGIFSANNGTANTENNITITDNFRDTFISPNMAFGDFALSGGVITVNSLLDGATLFDATRRDFNFSLIAAGDIDVNWSIQNPGSGDVNLIAGAQFGGSSFNGVGNLIDFPSIGTDDFQQIDHLFCPPVGSLNMLAVASGNNFGFNGGSVIIDATPRAVSVGSRNGATNVFGYGVEVIGGNGGNEYAQIGFRSVNEVDDGANADLAGSATGDIFVRANEGGVRVEAGTGLRAIAQIGHGGDDSTLGAVNDTTDPSHSGIISVDALFGAGGNVSILAGNTNQQWAMIGHGGRNIAAGHEGEITVRGADITLAGGGSDVAHVDSSAQIGHSGRASSGDSSGAITVEASGNLSVRSGDGLRAVSMIGHGGRSASGDHEGAIRVTAAGTFDLIAGGGEDSFAQVGHGGYASRGDQSGDIFVLAGGDITAESGDGLRAYVQIGQGGYEADNPNNGGAGTQGVFGDIEVASTGGSISFTGGDGLNASAQIGHGGTSNQGDHQGTISVRARGDLTFVSGNGNNGYSQLGHGGNGAAGNHSGSIFASAGTSGDFVLGGDTVSFGVATATGAISFTAGNAISAYTQLGHGGQSARGDHGLAGDVIDVRAVSGISFSGGSGLLEGENQRLAYALLGHGGSDADNPNPGNYADNAGSLPGFPTPAERVGNTADITVVTSTGDITFAAGSQDRNFAQLGHGGQFTDGDHTGAITVEATDGSILFESLLDGVDVDTASGSDNPDERYVMLGHGGAFASGSHTGDIAVTAGATGEIRFSGGSNGSSFAQLGHGGRNDYRQSATGNNVNDAYYPGTLSGDIAVTAGLDITFTGGSGGVGYAQLGHGGFRNAAIADEGHEGQIDVTSTTGAVNFTAGTGSNAFVQIGHGGIGSMGNHGSFDANGSGGLENAITVSGATGVSFAGGGGSSYAQIGHGGLGASFDPSIVPVAEPSGSSGFHLNTPVTTPLGSTGVINVFAGYAADGTTQLSAGANATFSAGTAGSSYAQVGHGGSSTSGDHGGDLTVKASGAFSLESLNNAGDAYSQLGHGGRLAKGSHTGNVILIAENDISLTSGSGTRSYTQIGHGGNDADAGGGINDGTISVTSSSGSLNLTASGSASSAQIGHGGVNTATRSGTSVLSSAIDIDIAGNGSLVSGNGNNAYAQIGHGGTNSRVVNHLGDICVHVGGTWTLDAATNDSAGVNSYVQIGHGGQNADGNHAGDVTVVSGFTNAGGVTMLGGDIDGRFVQIGHGSGTSARNMNLSGDIFVVANNGGDLVMTGGAGNGSYVMSGHGDGFGTYGNIGSGITGGTREGGLQYFVDGDSVLNAGTGSNASVHLIHRTNTGGGLSDATYLGGDSYRYIVNGSTIGNTAASGSRENQGVIINGIAGTGDIFITDNTGADVNVGIPGNPADQFTNDSFSFVVLATGNINFNRSVQNAGDGLIALVAGWNGVQDPSTIDFNNGVCDPNITPGAIDFDDKDAWGNTFAETSNPIHTQGKLTIGSATQTEAVMVGSLGGSTVLRGYEIELISSDTTADAFTQIGFHNPATDITGPGPINYRPSIDVQARAGGLTLNSGDASGTFTQIGHGGAGSATGVNIDAEIFISFCEPAGVTLNGGQLAGANGSYAQIGHGISNGTGTRGGDISLLNVSDVTLTATPAGQTGAFAQIGHGGTNDDGTKSGLITLTGAATPADQGDVSLLSNATGAGIGNFLQIGHGGDDADGNASDNITLTNFRDVTLEGGDSTQSHALIGHGGRVVSGVMTADVEITASRNVTLTAGGGEDSFAQIGLGGSSHSGNLFGAVTVAAGGDIGMSGGLGENAFSMIGLGGNGGSGTKQGLVTVTSSGGGLTMTGGDSTTAADSFVFIGNGGHASNGLITLSDTVVNVAGAIDMNAGAATRSYVQIGVVGQGTTTPADHVSDVTVTAGGDISLDGGDGNTAYAQIGMGGNGADGNVDSDITVTSTGGSVTVNGGNGANAAAKIGSGGASADGNMTGFIDVSADTFIRVAGASSATGTGGGFAMIGHGGITYTGDLGDADDFIRVNAGTTVDVLGGAKDNSFAMIGHGGLNNTSSPTFNSTIEVTAGTDITVRGGASTTTDDAYAMIGHGGAQMISTADDSIRVDARNGTLTVAAGGGFNTTANFAQVGHGGHEVEGGQSGEIVVLANAIDLVSGTTAESYAQIGHGGFEDDSNADGALSGNIFVNFDPTANGGAGAVVGGNGNITLDSTGGSTDAFTQIGHGGSDREGTITGNILIGKAANVELLGGGTRAYAQIGHGGAASAGFSAPVAKSGSITLLETSAITLSAGSGSDSYAQIGHGGNENGGDVTGIISLATDGTLAVNGGTSTDAYAQVGHGGHGSHGTLGAAAEAIVVTADAIDLNAGTGGTGGAYSQIGHGGFTTDGAFAGEIVINFNTTTQQPIPVGGALTIDGGGSDNAYAQIGHGGANTNGELSTKDGNILVGGFTGVTVTGGTGGADSYAQIGHGGDDADGDITGSVAVVSTGAIAVNGGSGGTDAYAQIGHGGHTSDGIIGVAGLTDATIVIGDGISLTGGGGSRNYAQIGFGGFDADGTINGQTFVNFDPVNGIPAGGGDVTLDGGTARGSYAQIGLGGVDSDAAKTGDVRVEAGSVSVRAGSGTEASASIGSGGGINQDGGNNFASGVITSNTVVNATVGGVEVNASGGGLQAYAQIGAGGLIHDATSHTGTTTVTATGDVTLTGGDTSNTYAQIGLGGAGINADISNANVTVNGNNITLTGGAGAAGYALIGAGGGASGAGNSVDSTVAADVTVSAVNAVTLTAGSGADRNFAQIGLGSNASTGEITVEAGTDLVLAGGGATSHAKIGHGTTTGSGAASSGDIHVGAGGGFSLSSGAGASAFAQIGHGIAGVNADSTGDIFVHVGAAALGANGGTSTSGYSLIGHGGAAVTGAQTGYVTLVSDAGVELTGGPGTDAFAQVGHTATGDLTGTVSVVGASDILLVGGATADSGAMIGHGTTANADSSGQRNGGLNVYTDGVVSLTDGAAGAALISHQTSDGIGSVDFAGARGGDSGYSIIALSGLNLGAGLAQQNGTGGTLTLLDSIGKGIEAGDVTIASGGTANDLVIGGGAQSIAFNSANSLSLLSGGDLTINGGILNAGSGNIGLLAGWANTGSTSSSQPTATGAHDLVMPVLGNLALPDFSAISITGPVAAAEFGADNGVVRIGDGSQTTGVSVGSKSGVTEVLGSGITVTGGAADDAHAQLGYFADAGGAIIGELNLSSKADGITVAAGSGDNSFAQIGHGGSGSAGGAIVADIGLRLLETGDLILLGAGDGSYAQVGHGGTGYNGLLSGDVLPLGQFGAAILSGGSGNGSAAQFGHGGSNADGEKSGDLSLVAETVIMSAGEGELSQVQVGHGGINGGGDISGSILVASTSGAIEMVGGDVGQAASAQIGHAGGGYDGSVIDEPVSVISATEIALVGGSSDGSNAMIGHGGPNASAMNLSGDILATAVGDISLTAGAGQYSAAQIGNGGALVDADMGGNITLDSGGSVSLTGNDPEEGSFAKVGHGDDLRGVIAGISGPGVREGDIAISADDNIELTNALVGHKNDVSSALVDPTSGTYLSVSSDAPTDAGGGDLIVDADSQLYGEEELRSYQATRSNNQIAAGALVNGQAWTGAPVDPVATQRDDEFTRYITGTNPSSPLQHNFGLVTDPAPVNLAGFAFYYNTIALNAPVILPPVDPGTGGSGDGGAGEINPEISVEDGFEAFVSEDGEFDTNGLGADSFEPDDRTTDDWQRETERRFTSYGSFSFFFEGFDQYGPRGEVLYNLIFVNGLIGGSENDVQEDDVLNSQLRILEEESEVEATSAQQDEESESEEVPLALR